MPPVVRHSAMRPSVVSALAALAVSSSTPQASIPPLSSLPAATVTADDGELVVELPPVDIPARTAAGEGMVLTPLLRADIPVSGALHRFEVEILDAAGNELPQSVLHHVNLTDPARRELFLPTSLHMIAASKETPDISVPRILFGMPVEEGDQYIASAMLANDGDTVIHGARIRLVFGYTPEWLPWPLYTAYPWAMDVMFPTGRPGDGRKAFDLPPGKSSRSWESKPAIAGTLLGVGGHIHDYGLSLALTDVTTGDVLWRGEPLRDSTGVVLSMPVHRFYRWNRLGVHIEPAHTYRVTVEYDNPTGSAIPEGGMAAVAGMFVPDPGEAWPRVDVTDPVYRRDLEISYNSAHSPAMHIMHGHH